MPSTAGYVTWVIDQDGGCPPGYVNNCIESRGHAIQPNQSLTYIGNSKFDIGIEQNLGLDANGDAFFDDVILGWPGAGVTPRVNHTTLFATVAPFYWIGGFGLRPTPANFTTQTSPQPSFMEQLRATNQTPSVSYGYTAGNQYRLDKVFGSLVLGGYDQNRFKPTDLTHAFYGDISRDLLVNVQSITTDKGSPSNLLPDGSISMFLDSTVPMIYLPESACKAFEQAFGLTFDENSQRYLVNSTLHKTLQQTNPSVTFTIGNQTTGGETVQIVLPYGAFDLQIGFPQVSNQTNYFPLARADNDTQYTLGRTFFQEAYVIVDYDRSNFTVAPCLWDNNKVNVADIKSILDPAYEKMKAGGNGSSGISPGAIAGIVVGVVALILIIVAALLLVRRKKQNEKKRVAELEAKEAGGMGKEGASDASSDPNRPKISQPIGGELGGDGAIHEADPTTKTPPQELGSQLRDPSKHGFSEMDGGEAYGTGKGWAHEMEGADHPIYEMPGSDVHEMPVPINTNDYKPPRPPAQQ